MKIGLYLSNKYIWFLIKKRRSMRTKKMLMLLCSVLLFTACGGDDDNGGSTSDRLEITLDDERKNMVMNTVVYSFYGTDIKYKIDPGATGKGVTWDFSAIDLNEYENKTKVSTEKRKEDYATSKFKSHYPDATECYVARYRNTDPDIDKLVGYYDYYTYWDGNIDYGGVQDNTVSGLGDISIWHNTPALSPPYPQYFGMKYTDKTTVSLEGTDYSFLLHADVEIDGEGICILPNGMKFTDVLRYKVNTHDETGTHLSYSYASKEFGLLVIIGKTADSYNFSFTDEWK